MINIEELARPLDGENPAGENAEYDPLYQEMESLAADSAENADARQGGHEQRWRKLEKNCLELWKKTRDLNVAAYLTVAETAQYGLAALAPSLRLLVFLVRELWDRFYPLLDPDDKEPLERLNILFMLSPEPGAVNDPVRFIAHFRRTRLAPSLSYTIRDLLIASGELESSAAKADLNLIKAELFNVPLTELEEQARLAAEAKNAVNELCNAMNEKMNNAYTLTMPALIRELDYLWRFYQENSAGRASSRTDKQEETSLTADQKNVAFKPGQTDDRDEALMMLRKAAAYFQKYEPNSPIPLLINRALRFADMSFLDLLEDIAPDALARGKDVFGVKPENGG